MAERRLSSLSRADRRSSASPIWANSGRGRATIVPKALLDGARGGRAALGEGTNASTAIRNLQIRTP
eukprot:6761149-Alexandrium_andersonii.AAC.1